MNNYDNAEPKPLKFLVSDGKLVDESGNVIAESDSLQDLYIKSSPQVKKYLLSDGSVVDENNNLIIKNDYYKKVYDQATPKVAKYLHSDGVIDESPFPVSSFMLAGNIIGVSSDMKKMTIFSAPAFGSNKNFGRICYCKNKEIFLLTMTDGSAIAMYSKDGEFLDYYSVNGIVDVIYSEKLNSFIGVGSKIQKSTDGKNWTEISSESGSVIKYSEKLDLFVVVGNSGKIITSKDCESWTQQTSPISANLVDVDCSESGMFIAVPAGGNVKAIKSIDGVNWVEVGGTLGTTRRVKYIKDLGLFFITGSSGMVLTSSDGETWTRVDKFGSNNMRGMDYNKNLDLLVFSAGTNIITFDSDFENKQTYAYGSTSIGFMDILSIND